MEEEQQNVDDFWLLQYQQLLDRQPERARDIQRNIDPEFAQELLFEGVIHCLPFLAKWAQTSGKISCKKQARHKNNLLMKNYCFSYRLQK